MRRWLQSVGIALISAACVVGLGYPLLRPQILSLLARYLSSDGELTASGVRTMWHVYGYGVASALTFGAMATLLAQTDRAPRVWSLFVREPLRNMAPVRPRPVPVMVVPVVLGLVMLFIESLGLDYNGDFMRIYYHEGGVLETLTALLMLVGSIHMTRTVLLLRPRMVKKHDRLILSFFILLAVGMFLFAAEEISWGQRIFHWETPAFMSGNDQNETTLHNYFNPCLRTTLRLLAVLPLSALLGIYLELGPGPSRAARLILPHASLLPLLMVHSVIASFKYWHMTEQIEFLMSLICWLYAARLYEACRKPTALAAAKA